MLIKAAKAHNVLQVKKCFRVRSLIIVCFFSTPLSDLKTLIFSKFKLSPSSHSIEFVGMSTHTKARKASIAVGKLDFTVVKITSSTKSSDSKHAPPPRPPPPSLEVNDKNAYCV